MEDPLEQIARLQKRNEELERELKEVKALLRDSGKRWESVSSHFDFFRQQVVTDRSFGEPDGSARIREQGGT
jgi:uncharacterized protein YeeX (DUF496 family)